ncbi:hypothetical protein [Leptospira idonii]|uniref:Uncharacterized protein n=1 Tax=Leptospira idonii TaxID=1193500 RepID=A0A4R9LWS1_9LEPT|nr:hypothetical protein [Leptospira idonii]TGN17319.1 hypothetical protein EHS15_17425 [Leptospira idonii]
MVFLKSLLIIATSIIVCGALGFIIPFVISLIEPKWGTALSMVPMLTVPIGLVVGLVAGICIVFFF